MWGGWRRKASQEPDRAQLILTKNITLSPASIGAIWIGGGRRMSWSYIADKPHPPPGSPVEALAKL